MSDKIFKVYEGTVDAFKATNLPTTYADRPVFIEGDASGNGRAIFANGEYYANGDAMSERGWRVMRMNGSDIYWSKIASISSENIASGGRDAWIEVEVNGDTNYPNACRFVIQITQYLNSAISVAVFGGASPIPSDGLTGPKPCVTVDANRNVWLKILNAQWDMYAAIRPLKQDAFGTISILGKAVGDGGHASNFEMQVAAPASTFLEGYGGLRYKISSGTYTLTGAVIDATATDAKKLGGVDASGYAKTDEIDGRKYVYAQGGLTDDQIIYALPSSKNGTEDDTLVSEMSLKTINGQSLVGSGDITIEGGGSGSSAMPLVDHGTGDTTFELTPNVFHKWGEVASLTLTLGAETAGVANQYTFEFSSGSTATVLALPDSLKWADDNVPTIEPNMIYQISILNGLAVVLKFKNVNLITNNLTVSGTTLTFDYPVASEVKVQVEGDGTTTGATFAAGDQTKSVLLGPGGSIEEVLSITPKEDSVYKYVYNA